MRFFQNLKGVGGILTIDLYGFFLDNGWLLLLFVHVSAVFLFCLPCPSEFGLELLLGFSFLFFFEEKLLESQRTQPRPILLMGPFEQVGLGPLKPLDD